MGQTGKEIAVYYKLESAFNTAPTNTGAKRLRIKPGPGLSLRRALINSAEVRQDGQTSMARLGSSHVEGSYPIELSIGSVDDLIEAIVRGTWTAAVTITQATASLASITTTTNTIVASAGSWITAGVRVGDIVRLTDHSTPANNGKNLRVVGVTASTLTFPTGSLAANAVADNTFSITILRKLKNPALPVRRSWYFEERYLGVDLSEVFGGCRIGSFSLTGNPDGMADGEIGIVGASATPLDSGSSPFFASPTETTSIALTFADAVIRFAGADVATVSAFQMNMTLNAATQPVIGSDATPDVFDNNLQISGSVTINRNDLANLTRFKAETEFELMLYLKEPDAVAPEDCMSIFLPRLKISDLNKQLGNDGAMMETFQFVAGKKEGTSGYDDTMITVCTSAT